jgi:hypothetical protein
VLKNQHLRHPEAPRFHQRGEGSRVRRAESGHGAAPFRARSLAWLKNASLRDDALDARSK